MGGIVYLCCYVRTTQSPQATIQQSQIAKTIGLTSCRHVRVGSMPRWYCSDGTCSLRRVLKQVRYQTLHFCCIQIVSFKWDANGWQTCLHTREHQLDILEQLMINSRSLNTFSQHQGRITIDFSKATVNLIHTEQKSYILNLGLLVVIFPLKFNILSPRLPCKYWNAARI